MTASIISFNPLDKRNLGENIVGALLRQPAIALGDLSPFSGAGIYAIYYVGSFLSYRALAISRGEGPGVPIYVGKAVPKGARRGSDMDALAGRVLFKRLCEHAESIRSAENLDIGDFRCRFLVLDDVWIPLGESLVISRYAPLWNKLIDGFGNHDPGSGRYKGKRSRWDVLHPGRSWVTRLEVREESLDDIARDAEMFLTAFQNL